MSFSRLFSAVPTPLDSALRIAARPLARHCKDLISRGCDGVVLFGTTGEGTFFSAAEKLDGLRQVVAAGVSPDRVILAFVGSALDDTVTMVTGASAAGCAASLVLPPFFTKQIDEAGLADWFGALIARAGRDAAILLYHIPAVAGVGFSPDLAERLFARHAGTIRGVKDSSPDSALGRTLATHGLPGIYVSTEAGLAENLASGIQGTISASLNITLPFVLDALAGDLPAADRRVAAIRGHLARHSFVWAVKTALSAATGDPVWSQLAPPHRIPEGIAREPFLEKLRALQTADA